MLRVQGSRFNALATEPVKVRVQCSMLVFNALATDLVEVRVQRVA